MPRQLEIRTTILAKKSDCVRQERDSNSNNVYPSEVLQMLEDLQKLKANIQKADQKVVSTYRKIGSKPVKKARPQPERKTAFDVIYPPPGKSQSRNQNSGRGGIIYVYFS